MIASSADLVVGIVRNEMARIIEVVPHSEWYLFGSITSNKSPVSDIDLLVVCESSADCARVRLGLAAVCAEFPIHLLLMTELEEVEVNFIEGERALEIGRGAPRQRLPSAS
jgi:predicted nucleotidyltransferase